MSRITILIALVAGAVACGGATSDIPGTAGDGGTDASTSPTPVADASAGVDASTTTDSGAAARGVACGAQVCTRDGDGKSRQICCVTPGKPPAMKCTAELDTAACDQGRRACDDAADCTGGDVCCAETTNGKMSTRCLPSCITGAPRWQVCKTTAECPQGIPCTTGICDKQGVYGFCVGAAIPDGCR